MYVHVTLRRLRVTIVAEEKQCNSERASVALFIQDAKRMRRITLSSVAFPAVPGFSKLSHKRHDFLRKLSNIKCVFFIFSKLLTTPSFILRRTKRDMIKMSIGLHVQYLLLLSDYSEI
jgi:hypothetical protein